MVDPEAHQDDVDDAEETLGGLVVAGQAWRVLERVRALLDLVAQATAGTLLAGLRAKLVSIEDTSLKQALRPT